MFSCEYTPLVTPSSSLCLQTFLSHHFPLLDPNPHPVREWGDSQRLWGGAPPGLTQTDVLCSRIAVQAAHPHSLPASRLWPLTPPTQGWGSLVPKPMSREATGQHRKANSPGPWRPPPQVMAAWEGCQQGGYSRGLHPGVQTQAPSYCRSCPAFQFSHNRLST